MPKIVILLEIEILLKNFSTPFLIGHLNQTEKLIHKFIIYKRMAYHDYYWFSYKRTYDLSGNLEPGSTWTIEFGWSFIWTHEITLRPNNHLPGVYPYLYKQNDF